MKLVVLIAVLPCIVAMSIAGYLCVHNNENWGWFLLGAIIWGNISVKW